MSNYLSGFKLLMITVIILQNKYYPRDKVTSTKKKHDLTVTYKIHCQLINYLQYLIMINEYC